MKYQVDEKGFYGDFGGAFIPEMLYPNVEELRKNYHYNWCIEAGQLKPLNIRVLNCTGERLLNLRLKRPYRSLHVVERL